MLIRKLSYYGFICIISLLFWSRAISCGCQFEELCLQVLGSGGPIADDERASSSYLIWLNGKARILIDVGSGSFLRFGTTDANFNDLDLVAITHMHVDHVNDLPAYMKQGYFTKRKRNLMITGPNGNVDYPSLNEYLKALFDPNVGAYKYLSDYYTGEHNTFRLIPITVQMNQKKSRKITANSKYRFDALPIKHGKAPTLAYRLKFNGKTIVFTSDHNISSEAFIKFAKNADLLVAHFPIPRHVNEVAKSIHASPEQIAKLAKKSGAKKVVLSHFMERSLSKIHTEIPAMKKIFLKPIIMSHDLMCISP